MARQLFIRLETGTEARQESDSDSESVWPPAFKASWLVLENGRPLGNIMRGDLSTAAPLAVNAQVVVAIPDEDVLLLDVALPGRNRKRMLNAVPFAVEDQLIDDVGDLHFALSQQAVEGKYTVAVIDHLHLQGWQRVLAEAGLQANAIIPDVLALPSRERAWTVFIDDERLLLRSGRFNGFASLASNMSFLITAALNDAEHKPDYIQLIHQSDDEREWPEQIDEITLVQEQHDQEPLALLACHYDPQYAVNLLQGQYSLRENISKHFRPWYSAAALFLVWLVWQGGLNFYQGSHLEAQSKSLDKQMSQVYRSVFPREKRVRDPHRSMVGKLRQLRKDSGKSQSSLQDILIATAPALKATNSLAIKNMRYNNGKMELEFAVKDLQVLEDLKQRLARGNDWKVDIQSASSRKDRVEARMQIKSSGS